MTATPVQRLLSRFAKVEPGENAVVVAAFLLFFFVLGSYFAVRPVRETVATVLGTERVADLWAYTAIFAILAVPLYGWLVGKIRRSLLLPGIYGMVALTLAAIGAAFQADPEDLRVGMFFYVWISVLNLLLVSIFWSFLLEFFDGGQARRLFGVIAAGGTLGALVGPALAGLLVTRIGNPGILYLAACGFLAAIVCQRVLVKLWYAKPAKAPTSSSEDSVTRRNDEGLGGNPFAGIFIVLKSRYLLGIASFVVLLSLVNTVLYFEQLRIVSETFVDREQRTQVFALLDVIVQSLTIFAQLFFTGRIATRLGVGALLTIVPAVLAVGFLMLLAFNVFGMIAVLLVMRRWGEYAFIRPGREMLWSTLDTESKYKAKSFIDLPVYRAADYIGAQAKTALDASGSSPASVALVGAGLAVLWVLNGAWLGRQYRRQEPSS